MQALQRTRFAELWLCLGSLLHSSYSESLFQCHHDFINLKRTECKRTISLLHRASLSPNTTEWHYCLGRCVCQAKKSCLCTETAQQLISTKNLLLSHLFQANHFCFCGIVIDTASIWEYFLVYD